MIVAADVVITPLTAFAPGEEVLGAPKLARGGADRPLEVLVEQESAIDDVRLSLELGWLLLRALFGSGVDTAPLRDEYRLPLPPDDGLDPEGRAELELLARRSLDGRRLAADGKARALELLGSASEPALDEWLAATADFVRSPTGPASWRTEPLEYRFRVGAPQPDGELTLSATEYRGGTLDWYHFRRVPNATGLGATGAPAQARRDGAARPAALRRHARRALLGHRGRDRVVRRPRGRPGGPRARDRRGVRRRLPRRLDGGAVPRARGLPAAGDESHRPRRLRRTA